MDMLKHDDFKEFLEFYKGKKCLGEDNKFHSCYDKITELSRSGTEKGDSLIKHRQEMYGLDWMVKYSNLGRNPPKSTDALFFRQNNDGSHALHIIEFKFLGFTHTDRVGKLCKDVRKKISCENYQNSEENLKNENSDFSSENIELNNDSNDSSVDDCEIEECFDKNFVKNLKKVKDDFEDPVKVALQLKPYEVIFITLPLLYESYCKEKPDTCKKDIDSYLNSIDKYYWAFIGNHSQSYYYNKSKADELNKYSNRLERTIFKKASIRPWQEFKDILNEEILENHDYKFKKYY